MRNKTATVRARTEPALKRQAEAILNDLGLTPSAAVSLFYRQIVHRRGIPFPVSLPNEVTRRAMRDAETGRNLTGGRDFRDLWKKLEVDGK